MSDKISVIVPVYNVEPYLERCLDSIINNTYRNLEIICVNDGSSDGCGGILDRYAKMDDRFVVIHKENGGVSSARNRGLDATTGEYVAFVDPDDWIHPQYFEIMLTVHKQDNCDIAICGFNQVTEKTPFVEYELDGLETIKRSSEWNFNNSLSKTYVWARLYKRELLTIRFREDIRFAEDLAYNIMLSCKYENMRVSLVDRNMYFYFQRAGSLVSKYSHDDVWHLGEVFENCAENASSCFAKKICLKEAIARVLSVRYMRSCMKQEKAGVRKCNVFLRRNVKNFCRLENCTLKEKLKYMILYLMPQVYRLGRIINDPTLLDMEKNLRSKGT